MKNYIQAYKEILFSFLLRDNDFPAVKKAKGYSFKGALKTIYISIKKDVKDFFIGNNQNLHNKTWLFAESVNQLRALEFLSTMENTIIVTDSEKLIQLYPEKEIFRIRHKQRIYDRVIWLSRRKHYRKLFKNKYKDHFNTIFKNDGLYESFLQLVKSSAPKAIIMSNDHNAACRALMFAGKENGVKTIYIQHAAVTELFPPLKFDLNLLDGEDSLNKYRIAGPIDGLVEFIGMPKFDPYFDKVNQNQKVKSIGIALNNGDDFPNYFKISDVIHENYPDIQFSYRFHPSINTDSLSIPSYAHLSNTKHENSFEYLKNLDVLFAGDSSIHLEATLLNVVSVYIGCNQNKYTDYYGFLKNGLVQEVQSSNILLWINQIISLKPNVRYKAKYYVDTIENEWDGKSTMLATKLIKEFIQN